MDVTTVNVPRLTAWTVCLVMTNGDVYQMSGVVFYQIGEAVLFISSTAYDFDYALVTGSSIQEMVIV